MIRKKSTGKKNNINYNYSTRMILLSIIILLVLSLFFFISAERIVEENTRETAMSNLQMVIDYCDGIFSEMSSFKYAFSNNISLTHTMKRILSDQELFKDGKNSYEMVQNTLLSQMYVKGYVDSLYLYYPNEKDCFYVTDVLHNAAYIAEAPNFPDSEWLNSYKEKCQSSSFWTEYRCIKSPYYAAQSYPVITLYNSLRTIGMPKSVGAFVINLDRDKLINKLDSIVSSFQNILAFDENGILCLSLGNDSDSLCKEASELYSSYEDSYVTDGGEKYDVYKLSTSEYNWHYIMLIKHKNQASINIPLTFIIAISAIAIIIQIIGSTYFTRKNNLLINDIMLVLGSVEKGSDLPSIPKHASSEDYLIRNALVDFIENKYYKTTRKENQYHQQVLELLALQKQMNPHFLFNTLHTINWKAIELTKSENDVSVMVENLSDILRYSLRDPLNMVSLREEVEIAKAYLRIENKKYEDKFEHIEWICMVDPEEYKLPKLVLQPILENCIVHAFPTTQHTCKIRVRIFSKSENLIIRISDNGTGITSEDLKKLNQQISTIGSWENDTNHVGIVNTAHRLKFFFGNDSNVRMASIKGIGTSVQVTINYNENKYSSS